VQALFPNLETESPPKIPGLSLFWNYVRPQEESKLVAVIDNEPWDAIWKRRRQPYGASYGNYSTARPIPKWSHALRDRLFEGGIGDRTFDQMLVNEYFPSQGIAMHRDYSSFDRTVVSLSLLSPCVMDLRHVKTDRKESILLEPRSLLVLSDESRYEWEHGIAARKSGRWQGTLIPRSRRLSITFRMFKRNASSSTRRKAR
jgi:alkylated DNA repair dioxygenase AlkB